MEPRSADVKQKGPQRPLHLGENTLAEGNAASAAPPLSSEFRFSVALNVQQRTQIAVVDADITLRRD